MIPISCIDVHREDGKTIICEITVKDYSQVAFKIERDEKEDRYFMLLPDGKWYRVPEDEYNNHIYESEIEDTCELDIDMDKVDLEEITDDECVKC